MAAEKGPGSIWDDALKGTNLSKLGQGKEEEYPTIPPEELSEAFSTNPMKYSLMRIADDNTLQARAQAEGTKPREKKYHEMGWNLSVETPQGLVGLWSCWLGNQLYLGYPKLSDRIGTLPSEQVVELTSKPGKKELLYGDAKYFLKSLSEKEIKELIKNKNNSPLEISDDLIIRILDLKKAMPVKQVNAIAVNDLNYKGEFADPDKPLEKTGAGQIIGYQDYGERLWAKFYGPIEPTGGRVWVDHSDFYSNGIPFSYIDKSGNLQEIYYGHERSNSINTFQFSFYNDYAPEGPTAKPEAIQKYKEKFIRLAAEIVFLMGGPKAINIDYQFSLVPEDLYREGYQDVEWLKGEFGERKGWGEDIVRGNKGDSTVILKSGNSLVPWSTVLRAPAGKITSPQMLADFIERDILWF